MCIDFDLLLPRSSVWATHYVQGMWNLYSRNHFFSPLSAGVFPRLLSSFPCSLPLGDATRCLDVCYAVWPLLGKWRPKSWICPNPLKFDMSPTGLNILPSFQTHFTTRWLGQKSYHLQLPAPPIFNHRPSKFLYLCTSVSPKLITETVPTPSLHAAPWWPVCHAEAKRCLSKMQILLFACLKLFHTSHLPSADIL